MGLPSTFDSIHPSDMIFSTCTYNKLSLYFQFSEITFNLGRFF